ncbi:SpoIVB peptidase S55 [Alloacidobacterium sp.]|uniref:SpoIVB peptidase S55 n=1 Tax=Alloacidobacterium sp. TaxID=2951999 RepID=UPI002D60089F|nr:SpoIVB peptidase S55 [Alloacidobacterium sp.]HYK35446.1 SpoIVB peptidase S55 [Alloacidobacterium sp.]
MKVSSPQKQKCSTLVDVGIRLKDIGGLILLGASALMAQPGNLPATPPPSTAGFYPLDQVHRGLHGVSYTVFEGVNPEPMGVQILGLLRNALGPGQDMILARLEGTKPEYTGVVAGMSGSPVYIDGKLLGAISYRIGAFSKEPIAGITPIGQMLEVAHQSNDLIATNNIAPSFSETASAKDAPLFADAKKDAVETSAIRPMDMPLVFNGFNPEALELWKEHAPAMGLTAVAGIGGSASDERQPEPIVPGSAVSALLMRGDLEIAATCTVTYVDPKQLLACGHPITQFGPVSMPMTKAQVVATLPSPLYAFKIINTTETVGSFTEDRESAIRGAFGQQAKMIPVTVNITGEQTPHALHIEVVDQPQITPSAVMVAVFQALMQRNTFTAETSYRIRSTVNVSGFPAVHFGGLAAPSDVAPANMLAALMVGERFSRLYDNAARQTPISSVDIEVEAIPKHLTAQLESAQSTLPIVHAGETITIEATIRPWRGEVRNVRIPVTLPAVLHDGRVRLLVSDGSTLDRITQAPRFGTQNLDVAATIEQLNNLHENDRLYVTLLEPSPQAVLDGRTLASVPVSMANVLEPLRQNQKLTLNGESAVPMASVAVGNVLSGEQVLTLQVE